MGVDGCEDAGVERPDKGVARALSGVLVLRRCALRSRRSSRDTSSLDGELRDWGHSRR